MGRMVVPQEPTRGSKREPAPMHTKTEVEDEEGEQEEEFKPHGQSIRPGKLPI